MLTVKVDTNGGYMVNWSRRQTDIINMGITYVSQENALPALERVAAPALALVESTLAAAQAEHAAAGGGEVSRATAAETYRQTLLAAKPKLNLALLQLKAKYAVNQAQLEGWGLDTVIGATGISVRKPRYDQEWATFLNAYVTQETSLEMANRLTEPTLVEMTALNTTLKAADLARKAGKNQREAAVQTRTAVANRLLDLLQTAALVLVVTKFDGVVTNDLQQWGYQVVARTPGPVTEPIP